jgi:hypothetical protein
MTLLVLLRRQFGERYLTWGMIANGCLLLAGFLAVVAIVCFLVFIRLSLAVPNPFRDRMLLPLLLIGWGLLAFVVFAQCYFTLATVHRIEIERRRRLGEHVYTQSIGQPVGMWSRGALGRFSQYPPNVERVIEPAVSVAGGLLLLCMLNWFGLYLIIGGVCLRGTAQRDRLNNREMEQDILDGQIYAEHMTTLVRGKDDADSQDFIVSLPESNSVGRNIPTVQEAFQSLPPELRNLVQGVNKVSGPTQKGKS